MEEESDVDVEDVDTVTKNTEKIIQEPLVIEKPEVKVFSYIYDN